jgi:hypothetical protein
VTGTRTEGYDGSPQSSTAGREQDARNKDSGKGGHASHGISQRDKSKGSAPR